MENQTDLNRKVANIYERTLSVNGSWCDFTNDLATLNLLGYLEESNYDFIIDFFADNDEFADVDREDLSDAIGEFLTARKVIPHLVFASDLDMVQAETGFDAEEIAEAAKSAGVTDTAITEFLINSGQG